MDDEYDDQDDLDEMFICVKCGDLVAFHRAIFSRDGAICPECHEAETIDEEE